MSFTSEKFLPGIALSFDDVLILQARSEVESRYSKKINLSTQIANGVPNINIPLVSSNMDTVTESGMAIAMAKQGGIGILHRLMTPQSQAEQVRIVKKERTVVENDPLLINEGATIADARNLLKTKSSGYAIVVPSDGEAGKFKGLISSRDLQVNAPATDLITTVMTPFDKLHTVSKGTTLEQAVPFMKKNKVEKAPIVDENGSLVGVYTLKNDELLGKYPHASTDVRGRLMVGAAIGIHQPIDIERALLLEDAGVDVLVLDVAHGALYIIEQFINQLKGHYNYKKTRIIIGNVSTEDTAHRAIEIGADGIKVGVGPGYVCDTRDVAGVGMPQISAIMMAREAVSKSSSPVPIMADGGIRKPADFAKAIVAGANSVMVGSLFAGTLESPGEIIDSDGVLGKIVRGMSSKEANARFQEINGTTLQSKRTPEGGTKLVPVKDSVEDVLLFLLGGLRSALTYTNSSNIEQMHKNGKFVVVTKNGIDEQHRRLS